MWLNMPEYIHSATLTSPEDQIPGLNPARSAHSIAASGTFELRRARYFNETGRELLRPNSPEEKDTPEETAPPEIDTAITGSTEAASEELRPAGPVHGNSGPGAKVS